MGVLTIRNVDDEVIARLKARAKANHRSLEGELRHILSRHAVPNLHLGLVRERVRAAYGSAPAVRDDTTDSRSEATDPCPDAEAERVEWLGAMRDMGEITGDIISPVSEPSDWDVYRSDAMPSAPRPTGLASFRSTTGCPTRSGAIGVTVMWIRPRSCSSAARATAPSHGPASTARQPYRATGCGGV
ncbi:MAG: hypothetical protein OXQ94_02105 [Gemmatimonadota bacterium]|nr:hypothetical protein [Gemmatimonadota bacterium]MDE2870473.1 hypothetical protein [Gemmatimonadota bacterium]